MNPEVAVKIFEAGRSAGADFVEIFEEETRSSSLGLKDRQIETATAGTEYGIGVRLLYGTEVLYGFTSDDSEEALVKLVKTLAFGRIAGALQVLPFEFAPEKRVCDFNMAAYKDPRVLGQALKQDFLFRADKAARALSSKIAQVGASVSDSCTSITLMNSEGLHLEMSRGRLRVNVNVTALMVQNALQRTKLLAPWAVTNFWRTIPRKSWRLFVVNACCACLMPATLLEARCLW